MEGDATTGSHGRGFKRNGLLEASRRATLTTSAWSWFTIIEPPLVLFKPRRCLPDRTANLGLHPRRVSSRRIAMAPKYPSTDLVSEPSFLHTIPVLTTIYPIYYIVTIYRYSTRNLIFYRYNIRYLYIA